MAQQVVRVTMAYEVRVEADSYQEAEAKVRTAFEEPQTLYIGGQDVIYDSFVESVSELAVLN